MSSFKMKGVVHKVGQTMIVSEKFSKRELVMVDNSDDKYPQYVSFEFTQDKTSLLDSVMEGQEIELSFNLRGREWTSPAGDVKYFNTLQGWKIDGGQEAPKQESKQDDALPF
jgi:single-strand DNA-binding protein